MNLKGITGPLTDKIASLVELVQEMVDNIKEQTETQKKILTRLDGIDEKLDNKNICKTPSDDEGDFAGPI